MLPRSDPIAASVKPFGVVGVEPIGFLKDSVNDIEEQDSDTADSDQAGGNHLDRE